MQVGWGRVTLDFTEAVITQPLLHIDADVRSGTLTLLTMPGIDVDADDVAVTPPPCPRPRYGRTRTPSGSVGHHRWSGPGC